LWRELLKRGLAEDALREFLMLFYGVMSRKDLTPEQADSFIADLSAALNHRIACERMDADKQEVEIMSIEVLTNESAPPVPDSNDGFESVIFLLHQLRREIRARDERIRQLERIASGLAREIDRLWALEKK
jgi:DUF971 family protein